MKLQILRKRHIAGIYFSIFFHTVYSQDLSITVNPPSVMLREYSYDVPVRVGNFNNVNAFQFEIYFNTARLELVKEPTATFLGLAMASNTAVQANANGWIRVLWLSPATPLNYGAGDLFILKFNVRPAASAGDDSLTFVNGIAADAASRSLNPKFYTGRMNVASPPRPVVKIGTVMQSTGATAVIPFLVANFSNVARYDFTLMYNSNFLSYQNTNNIPLAINLGDTITHAIVNDSVNSISYKWGRGGFSPFSYGNDTLKTLFNIHFGYSGGSQTAAVNFSNCTVLLPSGNSLEPIAVNGGVNVVTGVNETIMPEKFSLEQNYPNPFNPSTTIRYRLATESYVTLRVYTVLGVEAATLVNEKKGAGSYSVTFGGGNLPVASGVYFYRLEAGEFRMIKKMCVLK